MHQLREVVQKKKFQSVLPPFLWGKLLKETSAFSRVKSVLQSEITFGRGLSFSKTERVSVRFSLFETNTVELLHNLYLF